jgi:hypothetical protein
MEVSGQLHASAALTLKKRPRYPTEKGMCEPQEQSGRYKEKNLLPLMGIETRFLDLPANSLVAVPPPTYTQMFHNFA